MPDEARLLGAFALALIAAYAATPVAIAVATRTTFHDSPAGYKGHDAATPYLGGAAVLAGFLLGGLTLGGDFSRLAPIALCAVGLWAIGTVDDRRPIGLSYRALAEVVAATVLWAAGLGWSIFPAEAANLALTILWVVGFVNAVNLMDNMDGAAATVAAATGLATGTLAVMEGDIALAALSFGLCGACVGFLPYNLARPARIFLGDGGSIPVGFVMAAAVMALPAGEEVGWPFLIAAVLLAGLPVVDTALVIVSRRRRRVSLIRGGRDHIAHRLVGRLGTARVTVLMLGVIQLCLCAIAIGVTELGRGYIIVAGCIWLATAAAAVAVLETRTWGSVAPEREPAGPPSQEAAGPQGGFADSLVEPQVSGDPGGLERQQP